VPGTAAEIPPNLDVGGQEAIADEQGDGAGIYPDELNGAAGESGSVDSVAEGTETDEQEESAKTPERRRSAGAARRDGAEPRRRQSLGARTVAFLRASSAELQRMQWPDRRQTSQATAVVLGFVVVAAVYLGLADWVAQRIVNFIL
jgi:preprotein translocase SecE subunit